MALLYAAAFVSGLVLRLFFCFFWANNFVYGKLSCTRRTVDFCFLIKMSGQGGPAFCKQMWRPLIKYKGRVVADAPKVAPYNLDIFMSMLRRVYSNTSLLICIACLFYKCFLIGPLLEGLTYFDYNLYFQFHHNLQWLLMRLVVKSHLNWAPIQKAWVSKCLAKSVEVRKYWSILRAESMECPMGQPSERTAFECCANFSEWR